MLVGIEKIEIDIERKKDNTFFCETKKNKVKKKGGLEHTHRHTQTHRQSVLQMSIVKDD